jgi:hypothetical protein
MNGSLSLRAVLRHTFGIYTTRASVLLSSTITVAAVAVLDSAPLKRSLALSLAALLVNVVVIGMFVCVVVLLVADAWDGGRPREARDLLRGAWSALGSLLLVGVFAGLAITLLSSVGSILFIVVFLSVALSTSAGVWGGILGLLLAPVVFLVPELFLLTIWSVLAAVAVLERPGRLRALGRSRELVRGHGWRVLTLMLVLALPLAIATSAIGRAASAAGGGIAPAAGLLVAALVAPIPVLATTALYFELRRTESTVAPLAPTPPKALPPGTWLS